MKSVIAIAILLLSPSFLQAQSGAENKTVVIDKNLSLKLPGNPKEEKHNGMRELSIVKDSILYQVLINDSIKMKANNESVFNSSLQGIANGMIKNEQFVNFSSAVKDTVIGGVKGKYIRLHNKMNDHLPKAAYYFVTLQNNHMYTVGVSVLVPHSAMIENEIKQFFSSVKYAGRHLGTE